ncbi:MAG: hypothetical protein ABSH41_17690, partial [Syntrophobacteraceae bacterium]
MIQRLILLLVVISLSQLAFAQDSEVKVAPDPALGKAEFKSNKWGTAEINGVKWLTDPEGKPFYSK